MTTVLNSISFRGVEEAGESIFGNSGLIMDFTVQGALDLAALAIIWFLIRKGILSASAWTLVFCGFLVANLFGHTAGAYNLLIGVSADTTAQGYDSYMYLVFTIMLIIQVSGAGLDAWLRWSDSEVDIYVDLRPFISRFTARHLHLH
ncbi:MAG: hypothetical protein GY905_15550 [Gammaproteobacteria bacterium]|nr:hypothetical protein [Gammaproteobacteria bacterium]